MSHIICLDAEALLITQSSSSIMVGRNYTGNDCLRAFDRCRRYIKHHVIQ